MLEMFSLRARNGPHNRWLNNCIGFRNKKLYIVTLFYAIVWVMDLLVCSVPVLYYGEHPLRKALLWMILLGIFLLLFRAMLFNLKLVSDNITRWEYDQACAN